MKMGDENLAILFLLMISVLLSSPECPFLLIILPGVSLYSTKKEGECQTEWNPYLHQESAAPEEGHITVL